MHMRVRSLSLRGIYLYAQYDAAVDKIDWGIDFQYRGDVRAAICVIRLTVNEAFTLGCAILSADFPH